MNISLSQDTERFVSEKVKSGEFRSADELVDEALRAMRDTPVWTTESLRREIDVGIKQLERGEGAPWDAEKIKERVRQTLASRGAVPG